MGPRTAQIINNLEGAKVTGMAKLLRIRMTQCRGSFRLPPPSSVEGRIITGFAPCQRLQSFARRVHLQRYHSCGGMLRPDADGRYSLLIPCGRRPLAVEKMLRRLDEYAQWSTVGLDEDAAEIPLFAGEDEHEYLADGDESA